MPSLCFPAACDQYASKKISWEEYLHHCLLHYVDGFAPHEGEMTINKKELSDKDPFGFALWNFQHHRMDVQGQLIIVSPPYSDVLIPLWFADVSQLEAVFHAYSNGSIDDLKATLEPLNKMTANSMRKSLALLALRDRKLEMLRYIVNDGQERYDPLTAHTFTDMANSVNKAREPELFKIIQQSRWKRIQTRRGREAEYRKGEECGAPPGAAKIFDFW